MTSFQVDAADLQSKSAAVQGSISRLQTEVNTMDANLRLLKDSWRGQAANNFMSVLSQWRATQAKVEESLGSIRTALASASKQYAEAERANAAMFKF
ncbi:WXG100 family type VII secretion target [Micrococcoides hystricis]|uniref:ESAT-6-like protein n=1 Tax=Micrococcoides hystricis TaxID=1572761 RepID=A0ABV6PB71_9MICC